ncbi:unnamed protein product [Callosobruchus maculatus]|uniref:Uncharacterized protein n=1 Tax=Callosobruchus maculatus TaxID=64391 RepID=A0A653DWP4_CALMS|nr:unnamed protein product [Callosobruchus maculatus]
MCTGVEEDDEVVFCKICDNTAKNSRELMIETFLFITHDQILEKLRKDSAHIVSETRSAQVTLKYYLPVS